ncbi:MAG: DUF4258 domain-containing protein [Nitrospira sp.]|nr:DUF4258 domain-containing protein [Nitrospira sp.]MDH4369078.1 DUF4258 domain-containing protein [Nitrospira sp.]MDH5496716.1 DUF4258 domain-containing protein [Nitrospira sp.]MDH5725920.1 DUF4258 domain-containing protein [Nitrospira sp.]
MKTLDDIRRQLYAGEFEFSRHAFKRAIERNISDTEIRQAGADARTIEDYPDDKYAPSSLLLGFTGTGRPLHLQVSHADSNLLKIVTIYEPDPAEWYDYTRRR